MSFSKHEEKTCSPEVNIDQMRWILLYESNWKIRIEITLPNLIWFDKIELDQFAITHLIGH